jgi:hypothetical protein
MPCTGARPGTTTARPCRAAIVLRLSVPPLGLGPSLQAEARCVL